MTRDSVYNHFENCTIIYVLEFSRPVLLRQGIGYYVTVEACNSVLLCTHSSSKKLIVDNTDPVPGKVFVGSGEEHQQYQYSR